MINKFVLFCILCFFNTHVFAKVETAPKNHFVKNRVANINTEFKKLEKSFNGHIGVLAINMKTKRQVAYRANEIFPIQSTFKIFLVTAILKASEQDKNLLRQKIMYTKQDLVSWSPITEQHVAQGMTIFELCKAAMTHSDNTATNLLMKKLGGPEQVTAFARATGDPVFHINNWEPHLNSDPATSQDVSTPAAMSRALHNLMLGNILALEQSKLLLSWMEQNTTGDTRIRAGVPKGWLVADKTGSGSAIANDIAVIWPKNSGPIVLSIYTYRNNKKEPRRDDIVVAVTRLALKRIK